MAKTITIDQLVYALEGPKKKVPTYRFGKKVFMEYEKLPGESKVKNDKPK
jgi:hypothetical protein